MIISLIKSSSPERLDLMMREMTNIPQDTISKLKVSENYEGSKGMDSQRKNIYIG